MKRIRFDAGVENGVHVHRHLPGDDGLPVERHWPGLFRHWPEEPDPWTEYAVNNGRTEEIAVYLGLIWRVTDGLARYGVPTYYRDDAAAVLGREPMLVDWEYEVDAAETDPRRRDRGFVPGRSCLPIKPPPSDWQTANAARAGVFGIDRPRDLVALLQATLLDASAEVSVFAVAPGPDRLRALLESLRGPVRPALDTVLHPGDVFADLTIGSDLGYHDSITIASHRDLTARLHHLGDDYERRVTRYEQEVGALPDVPAFLAAMRDLTGLDVRTGDGGQAA